MKKSMRYLAIALSLILVVLSVAACGEKKQGGSLIDSLTQNTKDTDEESSLHEPTESAPMTEATEPATVATEPETKATDPAPVVCPSAEGGKFHKAYDLSFYLPEWMENMKYNGVAGVYEFYTGEFNGSPSGLDFAADVYGEGELNGETLETYVLTRSRSAKKGLTNIERVTYNGFEWLRVSNGTNAVYYYAVFNGGLYTLLALQGGDTAERYKTALDMFEATLFFATN